FTVKSAKSLEPETLRYSIGYQVMAKLSTSNSGILKKENWDSLESLLIILYYIFCLLFFCKKKNLVFARGNRIIVLQKTVHSPTKNCV
ncbi:hypothetical protein EFL90_13305, partial [Lactococcus lactis]|nr:hypothetical protein [Lactococcus lactis]